MVGQDANELLTTLNACGVKDAAVCLECDHAHAMCPLKKAVETAETDENSDPQADFLDHIKRDATAWLHRPDPELGAVCPRGVDIDALMAGLRRYQTTVYDWTGISHWYFTSKIFPFAAVLFVAFLVGLSIYTWSGPMTTDRAALNVFAPYAFIQTVNGIVLILLALFFLSNLARMFKFIMGDPDQYPELSFTEKQRFPNRLINGVPLPVYLHELRASIRNGMPWRQGQAIRAAFQQRRYWVHLLIITGFTIVFLLGTAGLQWFQRDQIYAVWHPVRLLGYYSAFALLYGVAYILIARFNKKAPEYQFSHFTDWFFWVLVWLTALSGLLMHGARLLELHQASYYLYAIHLMFVAPLLLLEIPFANGAMRLYRVAVLYLERVKQRYRQSHAERDK